MFCFGLERTVICDVYVQDFSIVSIVSIVPALLAIVAAICSFCCLWFESDEVSVCFLFVHEMRFFLMVNI